MKKTVLEASTFSPCGYCHHLCSPNSKHWGKDLSVRDLHGRWAQEARWTRQEGYEREYKWVWQMDTKLVCCKHCWTSFCSLTSSGEGRFMNRFTYIFQGRFLFAGLFLGRSSTSLSVSRSRIFFRAFKLSERPQCGPGDRGLWWQILTLSACASSPILK